MNVALPDRDNIAEHYIAQGKERALLLPYRYVVDGKIITIPLIQEGQRHFGFSTDGGTIPRAGQVFIEKWGRNLGAFIPHDHSWAFREQVGMSFSETNDMLYEMCLLCGSSKTEAYTIYAAVQAGGRSIWNKKTHVGDVNYHYVEITDVRNSLRNT